MNLLYKNLSNDDKIIYLESLLSIQINHLIKQNQPISKKNNIERNYDKIINSDHIVIKITNEIIRIKNYRNTTDG